MRSTSLITKSDDCKNQKQYKKENITALAKYDDAVAKLLSLYPDRKLPTISTLEEKRKN